MKTVTLYGLLLAVLAYILSLIKFNHMIRELSVEFYVGIVVLVFTAMGVWMGSKLVRERREPAVQLL